MTCSKFGKLIFGNAEVHRCQPAHFFVAELTLIKTGESLFLNLKKKKNIKWCILRIFCEFFSLKC
jgi:hypothetical protein